MVRWQELTKPKNQGGLGVRSISEMNVGLLLKWWWRYGVKDKALWRAVICSKYGRYGGGWWPNIGEARNLSPIWQGILSIAKDNLRCLTFISKIQI